MKTSIKLLKLDQSQDGSIIRLQSQLLIGQNVADFILENGVCKEYRYPGPDWHEFKDPYVIVEDIKEMQVQQL